MGFWKWSHEVNASHVKYLYFKVVVQGHCVASGDAPMQLTFLTPSDEFFGVFIHDRLEEPTLPDLGLCVEYSVMASIRCCMAFFYDLHPFCHWYTPPQ
jgi:hypothetical protein